MTTMQTDPKVEQWIHLAQQLHVDSIRCTTAAGSGHPTSSLSAADLLAVLLTSYLRYDFDHHQHPNNDHLIFSKRPGAPWGPHLAGVRSRAEAWWHAAHAR